jgi:putative Holliday junction resolvase
VRAIGVDLGSRRIGVAVSDSAGAVASPIEVLLRSGDEERDHRGLQALVSEYEAEVAVVGLPISLDGSEGPAATAYRAEAERMGDRLSVPVETYDERFTTVTAEQQLREAGVRGPDRRKIIDKVAAAVLLQAWLDSRALRSSPPGDQ